MSRQVFGTNLRNFRKQRGLTQQALADQCGYAQGYISSLERGAFAPSMAVLERLAATFGVSPAELLMVEEDRTGARTGTVGIAIINERSPDKLTSPVLRDGKPVGDSRRVFCVPGARPGDAFAAYVSDDSMAPEFGKGDLVVLSLTREPADGDACLVDTGKGQVLFRTVLAMPGRMWRLQAQNPRFEPVVIKATKAVRMWPAIGRWQMLHRPRRR